ncbi:energy-coupling factor ABC transporter permease [Chromatocurvus halotolerans]|uniref:Putative membrane protein n=1 Tax=Chromatocurvus halotolerans TaxID=1132028 RepID=A0A4R2KPH2_9GAMM|nr:energy-coupling factor ABC transporter permease [Chromatocurvus halotolerans]TCO76101.1 putative membrane protein [Chromatocurvus halotolerans]
MYIDPALLPSWLPLLTLLVMLLWLACAAWYVPWVALKEAPSRVHLVAGGSVACLFLWLMNVRGIEDLVFHLLGMTTLTLMLGWSLATLAGTVVLLVYLVISDLSLAGFAPAWFFTVGAPAAVTWAVGRCLYRSELRNPFVFILGAGFAGGALVVLVDAVLALCLFSAVGLGAWTARALEVFPVLFLIMFSEGFVNGMCVSALAVFYPSWMKTLDENFYFGE